jgi:hypothetical protein
MSYCVNCGVELERSLKKCPLCGVPVVNPLMKEEEEEPPVFPQSRDELKKKDRTFWIGFFSIVYLVAIVTCVLCNLLFNPHSPWSAYAVAGILMIWVFTTSPFYFIKFDYRKMTGIDLVGILAGLLIIQAVTGGRNWFLAIALPIVACCFVMLMVFITLADKKILRGLGISAALVTAAGILAVLIEVFVDLYTLNIVSPAWSWFVVAPCLSIAALLILLDRNEKFRQELAKRLHM